MIAAFMALYLVTAIAAAALGPRRIQEPWRCALGLWIVGGGILIALLNAECLCGDQVHSSLSPKRGLRLVITKTIAFPRNEWIDPSVVLDFQVVSSSGIVIGTATKKLPEDSDYDDPEVRWRKTEVRVTRFSSRAGQELTIQFANARDP